jgi:hydroxyethylthiazole kinase-like uncharacterized protein yjeF
MKLFTAAQIRAWDAYTIAKESVASIDLMERAAVAATNWLLEKFPGHSPLSIFCGPGNNGGDGLAIARLLADEGRCVTVFIPDGDQPGSPDFEVNLRRIDEKKVLLKKISSADAIPLFSQETIVIDALFGTGLSRPLEGLYAALVAEINNRNHITVSIDLPSGLLADAPTTGAVIEADFTITFHSPKLALLLQENGPYTGELIVLPIGLHASYAQETVTPYFYSTADDARHIFRPRNRFAHKGTFGHSLLVAGSRGKMGAAVLAATACLRGGTGLLSCHSPGCGYTILQTAVPEAMVHTDPSEDHLTMLPGPLNIYKAIGIGPGIGQNPATVDLLKAYIDTATCPLVLDADALNIISQQGWLKFIPAGSILTPHPKEFDRLFGAHESDFQRMQTAMKQTMKLGSVILLKGHHTLVATPEGTAHFNSTGNAGMAKGGSGDVLTGLLTALLAQGYAAIDAAILGVWLHGFAGDTAARNSSAESMLPSDMVLAFGTGFAYLSALNEHQ